MWQLKYYYRKMSVYSSFLIGSQHSAMHSKLTSRCHSPNKEMSIVLPSPGLFNSAHNPRPKTPIYSPNSKQQLTRHKSPVQEKQKISPSNVAARKFEFKPQNISLIGRQPQPENLVPQQLKYFKARKGQENNIAFESRAIKQASNKEAKTDFLTMATLHKERKASFNYDHMPVPTLQKEKNTNFNYDHMPVPTLQKDRKASFNYDHMQVPTLHKEKNASFNYDNLPVPTLHKEKNASFNYDNLPVPTLQKERKASFNYDNLPVPTLQKERKASFNYDDLPVHNSIQPCFSMAEVLPIQEEIGARRTRNKAKQWEENNNFQLDPEAQQNQYTLKINIQTPKPTKGMQLQRKHSDNECAKRTPAFLTAPKWSNKRCNKSESTTPRSKFNIQRFHTIKQLGSGAFGRVVLAIEKESNCICAIKILSKRDLREQNMIEQLVREIKIQSCLSHPNIVKIYGFFDDLLHFYIVMECALDHRLSDLLEKNRLQEYEASVVFYQLCAAVSQMHSLSIIHRDLKPENIMLHEGVIKVCDFGWSVCLGSQLRSTFCGTPLYLSPEIVMGNSYDESVDVWTLGIILYEMVIGGSPFGITRSQQLVKIVNDRVDMANKIISHELKELIAHCLEKEAGNRPNVNWLLAQSWVRKGQPQETRRISQANQ